MMPKLILQFVLSHRFSLAYLKIYNLGVLCIISYILEIKFGYNGLTSLYSGFSRFWYFLVYRQMTHKHTQIKIFR